MAGPAGSLGRSSVRWVAGLTQTRTQPVLRPALPLAAAHRRSALPLPAAGASASVALDAFHEDAVEAITDLGNPASFYPVARSLERRIVAHLG